MEIAKVQKMEIPMNLSETPDKFANRLEHVDKSHTENLFSQLSCLQKRGQFCDASLIIEEHEVRIHCAVLASASSYFFDLFMRQTEEGSNSSTFKLKDVRWETFKFLLDFIYTGRLSVPDDEVKEVYHVSKRLRIPAATKACGQYLISGLTPDTCLGVRFFAEDEEFREQVDEYIANNIKDVTNSKKFYGLDRLSIEIVGTDENRISKTRNDEIMPIVLDWLKQKMSTIKYNLELLTEDMIVLYLHTDNSITDCVDVEDTHLNENGLVQDYKKLTRKKQVGQINKAKEDGSPEKNGNPNYRKFNINPDDPIREMEYSIVAAYKTKDLTYMGIAMLHGTMITMSIHYRTAQCNSSGNEDPDSPTHSSHIQFKVEDDGLRPLGCMTTNRCAFGLKALNGTLFACGGYDRGECLKSSEIYDFKTNTWSSLDEMKSVRGRFSIGKYQDKIYAFGGSSGNSDVKTVECYDYEEDKWEVIGNALQGKASPGIIIHEQKLYVIGGCIGQTTVATCEVYDLKTNTWSSIAPMTTARFQVAITILKNKIYAVGGTNGWKCLQEVEIYDPQTNEWSNGVPLNIMRRGAGIDVCQGKIFIVGGNDGASALNSIEIYDPETHSWTMGPVLNTPRANCGVAAIKDCLFAVGGFNGKKFLNTMEYLDLRGDGFWLSHIPQDEKGWADKAAGCDGRGKTSSDGSLVNGLDSLSHES